MSWLNGTVPILLAGGGGPRISYEYLVPVERAPEPMPGDGHVPTPKQVKLNPKPSGYGSKLNAPIRSLAVKSKGPRFCACGAQLVWYQRESCSLGCEKARRQAIRGAMPLCACGCGKPVTRRRAKYATHTCSVAATSPVKYDVRTGNFTPLRGMNGRAVYALCHLCDLEFNCMRDRIVSGSAALYGCGCQGLAPKVAPPGPTPRYAGITAGRGR